MVSIEACRRHDEGVNSKQRCVELSKDLNEISEIRSLGKRNVIDILKKGGEGLTFPRNVSNAHEGLMRERVD